LPAETPSAGLWRRLWRIPQASTSSASQWRGRRAWLWAPALSVALVALLAGHWWSAPRTPRLTPEQAAAVKDFQVAMRYVEKAATLSGRATTSSMGGSLDRALSIGLSTWISEDSHFENGE